jgi:hypothetical protein
LPTPVLHLFKFQNIYVSLRYLLLHSLSLLSHFHPLLIPVRLHVSSARHNWSVLADLIMQTQFRTISISDTQNRRMRESERRRVKERGTESSGARWPIAASHHPPHWARLYAMWSSGRG